MNIMFWGLLTAMLLLAIAILVYPLLKTRNRASLAYRQSNLEINRQKLDELERDLAEGRIEQEYYRLAREELDRELLIDIPEENIQNAAEHYSRSAKRQPAMAIVITIFIPALAFLMYFYLGMHSAGDEHFVAKETGAKQAGQPDSMSVESMAAKLAAKIKTNGGTVEELALLGRAYKHLGKYQQASDAFAAALEKDTKNAQLMLEQAEVLALNNNRVFNDQARDLVTRAYNLQPENPNSLWFYGVAQYQSGNYRQAIALLKQLLPMALGEEDVVKSIIAIVAQSRNKLIEQGVDMPELADILGVKQLMEAQAQTQTQSQTTAMSDSAATATSQATGAKIVVNVDVDDATRQKFKASDTVFVYAKAQQGPRMPLAIQRMALSSLPATVTLDDSMAMVQGMNLSAFNDIVLTARISPSGSAIPQAGDYMGSIDVNQSTSDATAYDVMINKPVP